jgi:hypothetical protein
MIRSETPKPIEKPTCDCEAGHCIGASSAICRRSATATLPSSLLKQRPRNAVHEIFEDMANTFKERNAVYGSNYLMVAALVKVLFPKGVPPELVVTHQWHLFELKLVKLSRFAISNLKHIDSIHDDAVYAAMIEHILRSELN